MIKRIRRTPLLRLARGYFRLPQGLKEDPSQRLADLVASRTAQVAGRFRPEPYLNDQLLLEASNILETISPAFEKPAFKRNLKASH